MKLATLVLEIVDGHKTYAATALAVVAGLGVVLTGRDADPSARELLQALTLVSGGAAVAGLRHAISQKDHQP
jgi:uncharacterized protein (DUF697 family)